MSILQYASSTKCWDILEADPKIQACHHFPREHNTSKGCFKKHLTVVSVIEALRAFIYLTFLYLFPLFNHLP